MLKKLQLFLLAAGLSATFSANAQQVTITNGTANSAFAPVDISKPYSANEMIFLQSQINQAGTISRLAFLKNAGTANTPIENVKIYLKHTTNSVLASGTFDTTGYTRVFSGNFTNNAASGWMEVNLQTPFQYNNTGNLQVLFFRNGGMVETGNRYAYGFVTRLATRRFSSVNPITTASSLTASDALPNMRLDFGGLSGIKTELQNAQIRVYPNPATTSITIEGLKNAAEIHVTDLTGRTVVSQTINKAMETAELQIKELPAGIYLLKVQQAAGISLSRFIKE